jgi:GT2 family glycosyltransferase
MRVTRSLTSSGSSSGSSSLVSVIIVNWNARGHLRECLQSVSMSTYSETEVLVSDNGSTDGSQEMIRTEYPFVKTIQNSENLGFAVASNVAVLSAGGDFLFLVNNDAKIHPECVKKLLKVACSDRKIGILGCKVYLTGRGAKILEHAGGVIYPSGYTTNIGYLQSDRGQYNLVRDVDYVVGAAMMVRRSVIERVGLLDPLFGLYYEETDLCYRARKAGFRVVYVPDAIVHHLRAMTVDRLYSEQAKRDRMETSRVAFVLKNFDAPMISKWIMHELRMFASIILRFPTVEARSHLCALLRSYYWNLGHLALVIRRRVRSSER